MYRNKPPFSGLGGIIIIRIPSENKQEQLQDNYQRYNLLFHRLSPSHNIFVFQGISHKRYKRRRKNKGSRRNEKIIGINSEDFCQNNMQDQRSEITPRNKQDETKHTYSKHSPDVCHGSYCERKYKNKIHSKLESFLYPVNIF